jgi:hypothetical protein
MRQDESGRGTRAAVERIERIQNDQERRMTASSIVSLETM